MRSAYDKRIVQGSERLCLEEDLDFEQARNSCRRSGGVNGSGAREQGVPR